MTITHTHVMKAQAKVKEAELHLDDLKAIEEGLSTQLKALRDTMSKATEEAEGLKTLAGIMEKTWQEETDKWVEDQGTLGAMKIHPNEFTALEIIDQFHADNLDEMTEGMALVIEAKYPELTEGMTPAFHFVVARALEVLS